MNSSPEDALIETRNRSAKGETHQHRALTKRELEVLRLVSEGATNADISECLVISLKTTRNHLVAIFEKLGVTNRTQAALRAVAMGLVRVV